MQSALGQTFSDIEVLVVDDGSAEPVRLHDVPDERVRVIRHLLGLRLHLDHAAMIAGFERTLAKHPDVFAANRRLYARNLAGVGAVHMRARSWWPALRSYWASWRLDPGQPNAFRQVVAGAIGPHAYNAYRGARRRLVGRRPERSGTADVGSS